MTSVLAVFQVLIVFALVALILLHSGRDAGMGGMGFTPASQGGTHIVERNLTRFTIGRDPTARRARRRTSAAARAGRLYLYGEPVT